MEKNLKLSEVWRYVLPLKPALTLKHGVLSLREGLLLSLQDENAECHLAEVAPLPGWSRESLADCFNWIVQNKDNLSVKQSGVLPAVSWGLYLAHNLTHNLAQNSANTLRLNALLTADKPAQLKRETENLYNLGYQTFKLKVGRFSPRQERERIAAVLAGMGPLGADLGSLRLDANRSWALSQALSLVEHCQDLPLAACLAYIEEPLQNCEELPSFHQASPWPVALDESLCDTAISPAIWQACSALVLKPMLLGAETTLHWLKRAHLSGKTVTISSLFESPWGLAKLAFWAAQVAPEQAAGLDTWRAFAAQPDLPVWEIQQGRLILNPKMLDKPPLKAVYLNKMIL
ncbi:MAG: o-succinylbenzoate synthase [Candidatus Sericytochromatia bacterium]|nr:o-succinylbenzoate synthase [Candidatus Sericytochromatia bacterium]